MGHLGNFFISPWVLDILSAPIATHGQSPSDIINMHFSLIVIIMLYLILICELSYALFLFFY